jgi:hypothetical protein
MVRLGVEVLSELYQGDRWECCRDKGHRWRLTPRRANGPAPLGCWWGVFNQRLEECPVCGHFRVRFVPERRR